MDDQLMESEKLINANFERDEEEIDLTEKQHEVQPEDEEFLRDLDRAIMETFQVKKLCFSQRFISLFRTYPSFQKFQSLIWRCHHQPDKSLNESSLLVSPILSF